MLQEGVVRTRGASSTAVAEGAGGDGKDPAPLVGVIMGSDSDLPTMKAAADMLEKFAVPYELTIVSAHRTPTRMAAYAGVRCFCR